MCKVKSQCNSTALEAICTSSKKSAQNLQAQPVTMLADASHCRLPKTKPPPGLPRPLKWTPERELKRKIILEVIKRTDDYQRMSQAYASGTATDLLLRPSTPKNVPETSKRLWERQVVQWKKELKPFFPEAEAASSACSASSLAETSSSPERSRDSPTSGLDTSEN